MQEMSAISPLRLLSLSPFSLPPSSSPPVVSGVALPSTTGFLPQCGLILKSVMPWAASPVKRLREGGREEGRGRANNQKA